MNEVEAFLESCPDTAYVDVLIHDLCGIMRGKRVAVDQLDKLYKHGFQIPGSVMLLDVTGESADPLGRGFSDGDPDHILRPIPGTLVPVPWSTIPIAQVLLTLHEEDGSPLFEDPRHVLAGVVERFNELDLRPVVACELEFYLIDADYTPGDPPRPPLLPKSGRRVSSTQVYSMAEIDEFSDFLVDVDNACHVQGIPAGPASAEYATGQFEINLHHVDDPLVAADHSALLQRVIRGVARKHGFEATFMAKPYPDGTGNGLHIHGSMIDGNDRNVFDDGGPEGSEIMRHAIGGMLALMPESMGIFAPNVNSYRRFVPDTFVAVAPNWSYNNRSTAIRIPAGQTEARRFEHRVAGADANPYLTMAAVLAGVHYGIKNRIEPPAPSTGNASTHPDPDFPMNWRDALARLAAAEVLPDYLGARYLTEYHATKLEELKRFYNEISPLEYQWYLRTD